MLHHRVLLRVHCNLPGDANENTLLLTVAILLLVAGAVVWWLSRGPDASEFADLREPRLTRMNDQRMLVVEATGDPNVVGANAFSLLFRTYFRLQGASRMGRPPAPRARWPQPLDTPKDRRVGQYALPVSDAAVAPSSEPTGPTKTVIMTWVYGDVAERSFACV